LEYAVGQLVETLSRALRDTVLLTGETSDSAGTMATQIEGELHKRCAELVNNVKGCGTEQRPRTTRPELSPNKLAWMKFNTRKMLGADYPYFPDGCSTKDPEHVRSALKDYNMICSLYLEKQSKHHVVVSKLRL